MHKAVRVGDVLALTTVGISSQFVEGGPVNLLSRGKKARRTVQATCQQVTQPLPVADLRVLRLVPVGSQRILELCAQGQRQCPDFFLDNAHVGTLRPLRFVGQARGNTVGEEVYAPVDFCREIQRCVVAQIVQGHIDQ
ncbi:hypothetical protein D3C76_648730 [compost metagenome]